MSKKENKGEQLTRIAIVDGDRCKPKKCRQECKRSCPVVHTGEPFFFGNKNQNKKIHFLLYEQNYSVFKKKPFFFIIIVKKKILSFDFFSKKKFF